VDIIRDKVCFAQIKDANKEDTPMQITDVKIRKIFSEGPMLAIASITLEDLFVVHDVKVIHANERLFIVMPSRKNADGTYRDIAHPITAQFRALLEEKVLEAYRKAKEEGKENFSEQE
jgi:stage V sporulation protein G